MASTRLTKSLRDSIRDILLQEVLENGYKDLNPILSRINNQIWKEAKALIPQQLNQSILHELKDLNVLSCFPDKWISILRVNIEDFQDLPHISPDFRDFLNASFRKCNNEDGLKLSFYKYNSHGVFEMSLVQPPEYVFPNTPKIQKLFNFSILEEEKLRSPELDADVDLLKQGLRNLLGSVVQVKCETDSILRVHSTVKKLLESNQYLKPYVDKALNKKTGSDANVKVSSDFLSDVVQGLGS